MYTDSLERTDTQVGLSINGQHPSELRFDLDRDFWMTAVPTTIDGNFDPNVKPLAHLYALYQPRCNALGSVGGDDKANASNWKAMEVTLSICLQKLSSTFANSTMDTTVHPNTADPAWQVLPTGTNSGRKFCTKPEGVEASYCLSDKHMENFADEMKSVFEGSASFAGNVKYYSEYTAELVRDLFGNSTSNCTISPEVGITNFKKRIDSVAIAMTNA